MSSNLTVDSFLLTDNRYVLIYLSEMAAACIGVCIVAMLYEGLKVLRESILKKSLDYRQVATNCDRGDLVQTSNNSS